MKKYRKIIYKYYYMGTFNFGNWMNDNVFKIGPIKDITNIFGQIGNTGLNLFQSLSSNLMNISKGVGNLLNSSFLLPVLLVCGGIFVAIRLKVI